MDDENVLNTHTDDQVEAEFDQDTSRPQQIVLNTS